MKFKIANIISIIGHPLLTIPIFVITVLFSYEDLKRAFLVSALILGCIFIPLTIKMYRGSKKGTYTNFDVSDKNERQNWYIIVLMLLFMLTAILFLTNQSQGIKYNALFFFLLLFIAKIGNYFIKTSLHVALNVFLSFLIMQINLVYGVSFLVFVFPIAWSRLILKRHTLKEIIYGGINGLAIGILSFLTITEYVPHPRSVEPPRPRRCVSSPSIVRQQHTIFSDNKISELTDIS
jgi:membrane-associated phospholipid phosphatase